MSSYFLFQTEDYPWLAGTIFSVMALLAGGLVLLLPDTVNRPLPEVIEDVQAWTLKVQKEEKSDFKSKMKERRNSSKQDILRGINVNEMKKLDLKYLVNNIFIILRTNIILWMLVFLYLFFI